MNSPASSPTEHSSSARISLRQSADPRLVLADRVEQLYSQMPIGDRRDARRQRARGLRTARRPLRRNRVCSGAAWWSCSPLCAPSSTGATAAARTRSARPRSGCAGSASARSPPARPGDSPARCSFRRTPTSSRCSSPSCSPCWSPAASRSTRCPGRSTRCMRPASCFPFTYVLATFGNRLFAEIAFIVPAFYVVNVGIAYRLNRVFNSGYRLRHAYGKLTEDYSALNQRLEQQLVELERGAPPGRGLGPQAGAVRGTLADRGVRVRRRRAPFSASTRRPRPCSATARPN